MPKSFAFIRLSVCIFAFATCEALAQPSPTDLRGELPLRLEDALVGRSVGVKLMTFGRFHRNEEGEEQWQFRPQVQYTFRRHWQVQVASPLLAGPADRSGSGDVTLGIAHQFLEERGIVPHLAASASVDLPTGRNSAGADTDVEFLATKTFGDGPARDRLHFNGTWLRNAARRRGQREHHYELVAGYSRNMTETTVILADYAREQAQERGETANMLEFGVRQGVWGGIILSLGVGKGIAEESPNVRVTFGVEWTP
jgi:hypothetical protein